MSTCCEAAPTERGRVPRPERKHHPRGDPTMPELNIWAVLAAAVATFLIGGLWYSPLLFARVWQREAGLSDERLRNGNPGLIFGLAFVLAVIAAFVFAMFLGPRPQLAFA